MTIASFVLAVSLLGWAGLTTWRHRTGTVGQWLALQAAGWLAYAFVWKHFYDFGVGELVADGVPTGSVVANIRTLLGQDVVAEYFALFSRPEMRARHVAFWLIDIRDLTIVAFAWMAIETRRGGGGLAAALAWVHTVFLATLAGAVALFLSRSTVRTGREVEPSMAFMVTLGLMLAVCAVNTVLGFSDLRMSLQITLMFALGLMPVRAGGRGSAAAVYATLAVFAVADRAFGWVAVVATEGADGLGRMADVALHDPVIYGTITGEVINLVALGTVVAVVVTRDWRLALVPAVASATTSLAAACAAMLWLRETRGEGDGR